MTTAGLKTGSKTGLFVDVQNIYYTTKSVYGRSFDYRRLWHQLKQTHQLDVAYAYATDRGLDSQIKFQDALRHLGFTVKLKNFIQRQDGSAKGDWDVGITIDVLHHAPDLDSIILLSGDGDFSLLLDEVKSRYNCNTLVYGVRELTADALIDSADDFHPIKAADLQ